MDWLFAISGFLLLVFGTFDNWKYVWQANKMKRMKSSYLISRKFLLMAFFSHLIGTIYVFPKNDLVLLVVYSLGIFTAAYCYWVSYKNYPKRPKTAPWNLGIFILDSLSLLDNKTRQRYGFYSYHKLKNLIGE